MWYNGKANKASWRGIQKPEPNCLASNFSSTACLLSNLKQFTLYICVTISLSLNGKGDKNQHYMVPVTLTSKALKNTTQSMENNKCCLKQNKAWANEKLSNLFLKSR